MEEGNICLSKIKKRNKNKHEQAKKHKYFLNLNLIRNRNIVKNKEYYNLNDIIQPYYNNHKKNFHNFSLSVLWKKNIVIINKISVPSTIAIQRPHLFESYLIELPIVLKIPAYDFLDQFGKSCVLVKIEEINIMFISDLKDIIIAYI